eukprot:TRINITY_DN5966_c0_g1_i1.p1 TRINITY_DN5966_c0_g1~~TRINITY_DN5966_c0_g1_i1.p1  ORF type:complete len:216 (-),score=34.39 TRINITY_DN5966_c0_g1_i1:277-924(-)
MVQLTLISRISDQLVLCASTETMTQQPTSRSFTKQARELVKSMSRDSPKQMQVNEGDHYFLYLIEKEICYLTLCDKAYPRKLAIRYLEELAKEFDLQFGAEVPGAKRPYQFIKFDTFIQKTKRLYNDTKSQRNLEKVSEELQDVHRILTKNIEDILGRGEKLSSVSMKSDSLLQESEKYYKMAKQINTSTFFKKYGVFIIVLLIVLAVVYYFKWY